MGGRATPRRVAVQPGSDRPLQSEGPAAGKLPAMAEPAKLRFRRAGPPDVAALLGLVQSAYRGEESRRGWTTEADLLDGQRTDAAQLHQAVGSPDSVVLVAEQAGEMVACCQLTRRGGQAEFGLFAVRPALQGRGMGRAVLSEAEQVAAREWSSTVLTMKVIAQRADLIAWYGRLGYRPTGETVPFPYGDERFGLPRRPDLVFVVLAKEI